MSVEFVDTNVVVYAHDLTADPKRPITIDLIARLAAAKQGALSIQVLSEFYSVFTRKLGHPKEDAEAILEDFEPWLIHSPTHSDLILASHLARRYNFSWWDAMLVNSAIQIGATTLWTEDLHNGQRIGDLTIRNPFE